MDVARQQGDTGSDESGLSAIFYDSSPPTAKVWIWGSARERSMSKEGNRPEEALTNSVQELRLVVETIPALVWRAAPDGNFDYVNKRMLEYFGAPLSEVIGWGWMDKVHPDDVGFKVRSWLQNLESGKPHDVVCRIRGADGRYR
jgi:PAS domain S-box-containing protein